MERFNTFGEAIGYVLSRNSEYSKKQLTEQVLEDFPKAIRQESLQRIHDLLFVYAQSQPKLTNRRVFNPESDIEYIDGHPTYR